MPQSVSPATTEYRCDTGAAGCVSGCPAADGKSADASVAVVCWVVVFRGDAAAADECDAADQPSPPARAVSVATDIHPVVDGRQSCRRLSPRKVPRLVMLFWFPFGSGAYGTRSRLPGACCPVC